jgi:chromosome segregation ATPase
MKRTLIVTSLLAALAVSGVTSAQTASLETRLRDQLREARSQLQDLQGQQAQWQAQKAALEQERDAARKDAESAKAAGARNQSSVSERTLAAERARQAQLQASADTYKSALDRATESAHATETERARLTTELKAVREQTDVCAAKNVQLYTVGKDILHAYEHIDMSDVIASRQPFAAKARVRLETAAQDMGDKLYEQRFDARSVQKP